MRSDAISVELHKRLASCELAPGEFNHENHIRVALHLISTRGLLDAIPEFTKLIKTFAQHHGAHTLYHETITQFFMHTLNTRVNSKTANNWQAFRQDNSDLFDAKKFLAEHYSNSLLSHPTAKRFFLLPDKTRSLSLKPVSVCDE